MSFDLQRSSISLSIYGSLVAGATFFAFVRAVSFMLLVLRSSELLHNRMLSSVLMAPIKFFDTTPAGRILNRFSSDVGCMDEQLPICLYKAFQMVLSYVVSLLVVSGVIYYINIATVPAFVLIFYLCKYVCLISVFGSNKLVFTIHFTNASLPRACEIVQQCTISYGPIYLKF